MNVLVDTSVWSLALRRKAPHGTSAERELVELISEGRVLMIGAIRQELLSGIRATAQFEKLRDSLRAFDRRQLFLQSNDNYSCRAGAGWMERHGDQRAFRIGLGEAVA